MATANDFAFLINFIEDKIGLFNNKDFFARRLKNKTREMPHPGNFTRITLPIKGFDEKTKQQKFNFLMVELEKLNLNPIPNGKRILVKIPKKPVPTIDEKPTENPTSNVEPIEVQERRFTTLKEAFKKLPIFGVFNKDQPDLSKGIVNANFFDDEEIKKTVSIFTEIGMLVEERIGKRLNLSFMLSHDLIDLSDIKIEKREFNGKTIDLFLWIITKIYRIDIKSILPEKFTGISGRGIILCGEPEIFQIKKELEKKYGMIILLNNTWKTKTDFYVLTTKDAKDIYHRFNEQISSCDLISILRNPEAETEIKVKYEPKIQKIMEKEEKFLSPTIRAFLIKKGYSFTQGDEYYLQVNLVGENAITLSPLGGTREGKQKKS